MNKYKNADVQSSLNDLSESNVIKSADNSYFPNPDFVEFTQ